MTRGIDADIFGQCMREFPRMVSDEAMQQFLDCVRHLPEGGEDGIGHLTDPVCSVQYFYYAALVKAVMDRRATGGGVSPRLLDWGGQYGHVSFLLGRLGLETVNYVYNEPRDFRAVQSCLGIPHRVSTLTDGGTLDLADAEFDAAISSGVLEHVREYGSDEERCLRELRRVVKPGGLLFIWNLPCRRSFAEGLKKVAGRWYHKWRYTRGEISTLLESSGWRILAIDEHEFMPIDGREVLSRLTGVSPARAFQIDYGLSKIPFFNPFAQHFTIVCERLD